MKYILLPFLFFLLTSERSIEERRIRIECTKSDCSDRGAFHVITSLWQNSYPLVYNDFHGKPEIDFSQPQYYWKPMYTDRARCNYSWYMWVDNRMKIEIDVPIFASKKNHKESTTYKIDIYIDGPYEGNKHIYSAEGIRLNQPHEIEIGYYLFLSE